MTTDKSVKRETAGRALRRAFAAAMTFAIVAAIASGPGAAQRSDRDGDNDHESRGAFAIGLWGDLPYSVLQATVHR